MKLALIALAIEICIARLFAGSWGWAVVIVLLYCTLVYLRQKILIKKQEKNESRVEFENLTRQDNLKGNKRKRKQIYNMFRPIGNIQNN